MLILLGPSASGKTEVAKLLKEKFNITKIITYTTREKRINEVNGVDYHFVSVSEFLKLKEENFFVETTFYNNNYYGTAKKDIKDDKCVVLDPNGLVAFNNLNDNRIISIYLKSSEDIRYQRMINRKDSVTKALERINHDKEAFNDNKLANVSYVIENDDIDLDYLANKIYEVYISALRSIQ